MKRIFQLFRNLYYKLALLCCGRAARNLAHRLFMDFMNQNNLRYRISNDKLFMDAWFEIFEGKRIQLHYDFNSDDSRIIIQSIFITIETSQIPQASLLISHLNTLLNQGKLMINFRNLNVYLELELNNAAITLNPSIIDSFHHKAISMPSDFLWCFQQVFDINEDPVVVIGQLLRKYEP